jgi:hypothetical protein
MNTPDKHAEGLQEHSLCGLAFDAFDTGDYEEPVVFAKTGQRVTCERCREHIDWVRDNFTKTYGYTG